MGRQPCCDKLGVKKGPWTADEDRKLVNFIVTHGQCCWRAVPKLAGLRRCGKSCRLRWTNYLRPDLKRGLLNDAEEQLVIQLHARLGNRWSKIAAELPGRTDNEIKNHWNTHIKKKLVKMGIDPVTHRRVDGGTECGSSDVPQKGSNCSSENGSSVDDEPRLPTSCQVVWSSSAAEEEVDGFTVADHIESTWSSCLPAEPDWGWSGLDMRMKDPIGDELGFLDGFGFGEMDLTELDDIS